MVLGRRTERVFCYLRVVAFQQKKLKAENADSAFKTKNWKDAMGSFRSHEGSSCHKEAVEKLLTLPATTKDIGESQSSIVAEQKQCNRACFLKVLDSIRYLSR